MVNVAVDSRNWARRLPAQQAISAYASTIAYGLFDPPPG
jgi:hypothetical protein